MATVHERWTPAGPIRSEAPLDIIEQEETRAAASVGEAAPLGLFGFASATFTLSAVNAGWFPMATVIFAMPLVLIFGGIAQFIAGMWSYRKGDTFAATAFGSFGAFNTTYALFVLFSAGGLVKGPAAGTGVIGIFIACFSLIAFVLMLAAMRINWALVGVLFFLALTYGLLGAGEIAGAAPNLLSFGGWAGLISSVIAFYTGAAMVVNSVNKRVVLPLGAPQS
jgi:succinate-acetate transporter protein